MFNHTNTGLRQAQALFDQVLELAPADRAPFLMSACGDDGALRSEILALLTIHERIGEEFMRPPAPQIEVDWCAGHATTRFGDELIGSRIGRYHVVGLIGCGGMGTVYEAVQDRPSRVVALKVLSDQTTPPSVLRRFHYEAQVLAWLRHPNIAQIFEAGEHVLGSGQAISYLAMECVSRARPITRYAIDERLTVWQRLSLLAKVCDAIHHGHQTGIIHRDIKPANILVDSTGEPKVIDFGVARAIDAAFAPVSPHTTSGRLVGTMQYMSPEQCTANPHDLDTRSDVYSLGIVLYELLAGTPPYAVSGSTIHADLCTIQSAAPRRLSMIDRRLRRDVETIAFKALEKDREKRYESAAELAADLRRCINREPIAARPPSSWEKLARWVCRHPVIATLVASASVGVLVLGMSFAGAWYVGLRPSSAAVMDDHREFRVWSLNGNVIYRLRDPTGGPIQFVVLSDALRGTEDERLLLLGINGKPFAGLPLGLHVFNCNEGFNRPSWSLDVRPEELPERCVSRGFAAGQFGAWRVLEADIFDDPDLQGAELVAVHKHADTTHSVMRVVDRAGQVHWQIWMDVLVDSLYWMEDAKLLVILGVNGEQLRYQRGMTSTTGLNHPRVVFSLRPLRGFVRSEYLAQEVTVGTEPNLRPVWYWCLPPFVDDFWVSDMRVLSPAPRVPPGRHALLSLSVSPRTSRQATGFAVSWILSEGGGGGDAPVFTDGYQLARDGQIDGFDSSSIPPAAEWWLVPLPAVVPD